MKNSNLRIEFIQIFPQLSKRNAREQQTAHSPFEKLK